MNSNSFWLKQSEYLVWKSKPQLSFKKKLPYPESCIDVYYNLIERHLKKKIGLYFIDLDKKLSFLNIKKIDKLVNTFSLNFLEKKIIKNDKVMLHVSSSLESAISMLSCAQLGIFFSVVFEELSLVAIKQRIFLFNPRVFITKSKNIYNSLKRDKEIFCEVYLFNFFFKKKKYKKISNALVNSKDNFFTLFTSGTTGLPKGIVHGYTGYLVYSNYTCRKQFGLKKRDTVFTASDAGWINGHTYALFGPLSIGCSSVLIEKPSLLTDELLMKKILKLGVNVLYLPVTLIRIIKSVYEKKKIKYKTLRTLGSMGEPLAEEVGKWYANKFSLQNKAIVNTYFQTETGGIICSPRYSETSKKVPHGSVGKPCSKFIILDTLSINKKKEIIIKTYWPGCMKGILNGKKIWSKYWNTKGHFKMFDLGSLKKSNLFIHGRSDDVINIRGHRIGSAEIESIILKNSFIIEACSVAVLDYLEGNSIYLFLVAKKKNDQKIKEDLIANFGTFAIPKKIIYCRALPKTRSGKIVRRLLRDISCRKENKNFGDLSTLVDKSVIKQIINELKK